jgi:glycosyltransferase involved in cell wall biosynthesis
MITVILNGYNRGANLQEQLDALKNQTLPPDEILVWYNNPGDNDLINYDIGTEVPVAYCNYNFGVWARFAYAFMAKNEYVCIFDDDTIPGKKWLENCMNTMKTHEGLLGTVGLIYPQPLPPQQSSYYERYVRVGWPDGGNNEETLEVDLVGHSWFFKKEWLSHMWREIPDPKYNTCGEDMHFSYMLQKYAGIKTFVPPHPISDNEMWGSIKGAQYGGDTNSLWESNQRSIEGVPFRALMNEYFHNQRLKGWKLVYEK